MKLFSQRMGLKQAKTTFQIDSIDTDLRNGLWTALDLGIWKWVKGSYTHHSYSFLARFFWTEYFKEPLDTMPFEWSDLIKIVRDYFYKAQWYEIYDFIEFAAQRSDQMGKQFTEVANVFLERELSSYRFVDTTITKITDQTEIGEIDEALNKTPVDSVKEHLSTALGLMSDRKNPDYRNSIKESISAVEALASLICGDKKATLGDAIKLIEKQARAQWHPVLKAALDKLYGYTSDEGGIRHFLKGDNKIDFEEAKFMLVTCSAFVNYLVQESAKARIKL